MDTTRSSTAGLSVLEPGSPVSASSSPRSPTNRTSGMHTLPWRELARHLKLWLGSMVSSQASGNARQILKLMEALVTFMQSNNGFFIRTLMASSDIRKTLRQQGATEHFIDTFMEVLQVADLGASKVLSFGVPAAPLSDQLHHHCHAPDTRGRAPSRNLLTPTRPRSLPALGRSESSASIHRAPDLAVALIDPERSIEAVSSLQRVKLSNAVTVPPESLPPEVSHALSEERAVPFVIFNWLTAFYAEVLFCVRYAEQTFVLLRKIVYVPLAAGSLLEGTATLPPCAERGLLQGSLPLPWRCAAGLLEASAEMMQGYL